MSQSARDLLQALYAPVVGTATFLELVGLWGGDPGFPKNVERAMTIAFDDVDWLDNAIGECQTISSERENVYFGVNPRVRPVGPGHPRSEEDDVECFVAFWADADPPKDKATRQQLDPNWKAKHRDAFAHPPIPPSARVDSGHGYHYYWLLKEPFRGVDAGKAMLKRIRALVPDADKQAAHSSRILRLPGFPNLKNPEKPIPTSLDWLDADRRYTFEEIVRAFPEPKPEERKSRAPASPAIVQTSAARSPRRLAEAERARLLETWTPGQRHAIALALAGAMRKAGWSEDEAAAEIAELGALAGDDEDRRANVRTTWEKDLADLAGWSELEQLGVKPKDLPTLDRPHPARAGATADGFQTDMGNARAFVAQHGADFRFAEDMQQWFAWDGRRWTMNANGLVEAAAKSTALSLFNAALAMDASDEEAAAARKEALKHARRTQGHVARRAMLATATSEPEIAMWARLLDCDPWALNVANGTIDLRGGELRPHRRQDLLTRLSPIVYDPKAEAPRWESFLLEIMQNDFELCHFLQLAVGYTLTGSTREQCFFLMHGSGSNGKSTFIESLKALVGDLAETTPFETFTVRQGDRGVPNDLAKLRGARLVTASEAEEGARFSEALIKSVTGQDTITARFLNKEFFDFVPAFKLWLAANHKPHIRGTDHAIWRRVKLIPFEARFEGETKDPYLAEKLKSELPGILTWAVRGARLWFEKGLPNVGAIETATNDYRNESDVIGRFLVGDQLVQKPAARISASAIYELFRRWCEREGERAYSNTKFGRVLAERGLAKKKLETGLFYLGLEAADSTFAAPDDRQRRIGDGDF